MKRLLLVAAGLGLLCALAGGVLAGPGTTTGFVIGSTWQAGLAEPAAVDVLADGTVVIADIARDVVMAVGPMGKIRWRVSQDLDHPSGIGVADEGIWIADAGNHRLVLLSPADGRQQDEIILDEHTEPIDVCVAADGRLWVALTPQNRILVLDSAGAVEADIDAIDGTPLEGPRGLVSDGDGGVLVTETLAGRVLHLADDGTLRGAFGEWGPGEGRFYKPKDVAVLADGAMAVVDSHKGAVQILERDGTFRQLISGPAEPLLFAFPIGIAAHEGSLYVTDAGSASAYRLDAQGSAWRDGRFPPEGELASSATVRDADPSFVCRQCHDGTRVLASGNWDPGATNHPLVLEEDDEIPERFRTSESGDMTCHTCHFVHREMGASAGPAALGEVVDFGLPREGEQVSRFPGNDLCVECHDDYLDTETSHRRKSHPIGLAPPAGTAAEELIGEGARFEGERLVCMSCHPPHGAHADPLLISAASNGDLCTSCHADHASGFSRHAVDVEVDRITLNRVESMGGAFAPDGHLTCLSCHDPHQSTSATLLRMNQAGTDACRACHVDESRAIRAGGHGAPACQECHGMHTRPGGFGDGQRRQGVGPDQCLDCHTDGSEDPQISLAASHPLGTDLEPGEHGYLPDYDGRLGCSTCHDAHAGTAFVLRSDDGVGPLCLECHADKGAVLGTDHDASVVAVDGERRPCLSCHAAHGSDLDYLMTGLADDGAGEINPANGRCLACHDGSTDATPVDHYTHPERLMLTVGGLPFRYDGPVPYYGPDGEQTENRQVGEITCMTCHDPHRWRHDAEDRPGEVDGSELNSFLRDPDEIVRFCEVCHGLEGRPQLTFFHEDEYRLTLDQGEDSP